MSENSLDNHNLMENRNRKLRVAIIGASGIGKNHANWFVKNGCEIAAFAGTSAHSVAATGEELASRLGYAPRGYTDVSQLLQSENLDAVCISSPPALHFEHVCLCLDAGLHTLCEKPLVYDANLPMDTLLAQASELVAEAEERDVLLGTQMQYCFLISTLCEMAGVAPEAIETFTMEIETKNLKPGRSHDTIWIELAPHPLSVLQKIAPGAHLDIPSISCTIGERETSAAFQLQRLDGSKLRARIIARDNRSTAPPVRRFVLNGQAIDCAGRRNADGQFMTYLTRNGIEIEMRDPVDILIGNFVAACRKQEPLCVTGRDGALNTQWLLQILAAGERSAR